jgi:diacylglycerol O-acyltransferase
VTQPIAPLDLSFLLNETRDSPQHVAGVLVFENPKTRWTPADLVRHYRAATPLAPFDRIPNFRHLGPPRWVSVNDFDMLYHVQHVALPRPGTDAQLDELVQQWHSELLDRHRPLFQMFVIEGLQGDRFAIYAKVHHAVADGASAVMRLLGSLSENPAEPLRPALFAVDLSRPRAPRTSAGLTHLLSDSVSVLKRQAAAARELSGEFVKRMTKIASGETAEGSVPFGAPMTLLNAPVRYGRAFAHLSLPMAPLREAAKAHGGTLNDAVLAIVGHAVVRYLTLRGRPPRRPLHAVVPVSLRDADAGADGNRVSGVACALGDPGVGIGVRLRQTVEQMNAAKERIRGFSKEAATNYFIGLLFLAQGLGAVGVRRPIANFVVSNVPGPAGDTYLGGAKLLGVYPMNVLTIGLGLSVTLVSRSGQLDIGFIAGRSVVPDPGRIAALCTEAFDALLRETVIANEQSSIAAPAARARKPAARRRTALAAKEPRA